MQIFIEINSVCVVTGHMIFHLQTGLLPMSPTTLVLGKGLKLLPLSWDSACLNEQDPSADLRVCLNASETKSSVHESLCIRVFVFTSSCPNLLTASLLQSCRFLKSLTSLSDFASNPYYYEKIIGSDSSPCYKGKVKTPKMWECSVRWWWIIKQSAALLMRHCHIENIEQLRVTLVCKKNFSVWLSRRFLPIIHSKESPALLSAVLSSSLMNPFPLCRSPVAVSHGCYCLALLRSVPAAAYIVLVTVLRYHLFIWSVFSPKLLYESMHLLLTAGVCLFFNTMEQSHSSSKS